MARTQEDTSSAGKALDPWDDPANDIAVMVPLTAAQIELAYKAIAGEPLPENVAIGGSGSTAQEIQAQIREGKTLEDVFGTQKLKAWQDIAGEPVTVLKFHLNPSTIKPDPGKPPTPQVYAVVTMVRSSGEIEQRQCGGGNVLVQLMKAAEEGWFPLRVKIAVGKVADTGNTVLRLEKADG
jgi:hypothetical protein